MIVIVAPVLIYTIILVQHGDWLLIWSSNIIFYFFIANFIILKWNQFWRCFCLLFNFHFAILIDTLGYEDKIFKCDIQSYCEFHTWWYIDHLIPSSLFSFFNIKSYLFFKKLLFILLLDLTVCFRFLFYTAYVCWRFNLEYSLLAWNVKRYDDNYPNGSVIDDETNMHYHLISWNFMKPFLFPNFFN